MTVKDVATTVEALLELARGARDVLKSFVRPKTKRVDVPDELQKQVRADADRFDREHR